MDITYPSAPRHRPQQRRLVAQQRPDAVDRGSEPELLSSLVVLPEQFFPFQTSSCPERPETALMLAVLEDALVCYQQGFMSGKRRAHRLAREAEAWFLSDDNSWSFSFVYICAVLGLEPGYIRREVKKWKQGGLLPAGGDHIVV